MSTTTPRRAAKRLNDHHEAKMAGFYGRTSATGTTGRFFGAQVRNGVLQVTQDFGDTWADVDLATCHFEDHNGRPLYL